MKPKESRKHGARLDIRVSPQEKKNITKKARKYKTTITEHIVRASESYTPKSKKRNT